MKRALMAVFLSAAEFFLAASGQAQENNRRTIALSPDVQQNGIPPREQTPSAMDSTKNRGLDLSTITFSIGDTKLRHGEDIRGAAAASDCDLMAIPPRILNTHSKYAGDDHTKSNIDQDALEERNHILQPIRNSIRLLTREAYTQSGTASLNRSRANCVSKNALRWARASALSTALSPDAIMTRDRFIAEIALALLKAKEAQEFTLEENTAFGAWLRPMAKSTIDYYSYRAGPKSKVNNHRYWAGLSVAAIGYLTGDHDLIEWGQQSFNIGVCQVTADGFLPLELARGRKSLEYHVYALRPLLALLQLAQNEGDNIQTKCPGNLERLTKSTMVSIRDKSVVERIVGIEQEFHVTETSYSEPLRLQSLVFSFY
ncbi:alginate lyase family protein [Rhizobium sp. MHM7A]|uniref:alginate lyase family protein n=1 Tax=Rhizobium sp. MHM7A TaxID=2583233 RepID=UPI00110591B8|nr:alginate lyase family protein [Rhizobium sp. MHM7A]TLX16085.1 hypothetical protein FFR93_01825 [Rhizobium sp. MHM7A]